MGSASKPGPVATKREKAPSSWPPRTTSVTESATSAITNAERVRSRPPARGSSIEALPAGWSLYRVMFDDESQALFVALGLGTGVWVEEPQSLRERVWQEARALTERRRASYRDR